MKTEPAMPLEVGNYLADTMHLDRAEHGSYLLLIMAYWANAGPLPNDDHALRTIAKCPETEWMRTKGTLAKYFDVSNGCWTHKRIDTEIARSRERKRALAEASAKGVQARRELGQIPPTTPGSPPVKPGVNPVVERISSERELDRVETRLGRLKEAGTLTAGAPMRYTEAQRKEISELVARKKELVAALGYKA